MSKAEEADKIARWRAPWLAYYIDKGWITQWPWEITKRGRKVLKERKLEALVESRVRMRLKRR